MTLKERLLYLSDYVQHTYVINFLRKKLDSSVAIVERNEFFKTKIIPLWGRISFLIISIIRVSFTSGKLKYKFDLKTIYKSNQNSLIFNTTQVTWPDLRQMPENSIFPSVQIQSPNFSPRRNHRPVRKSQAAPVFSLRPNFRHILPFLVAWQLATDRRFQVYTWTSLKINDQTYLQNDPKLLLNLELGSHYDVFPPPRPDFWRPWFQQHSAYRWPGIFDRSPTSDCSAKFRLQSFEKSVVLYIIYCMVNKNVMYYT